MHGVHRPAVCRHYLGNRQREYIRVLRYQILHPLPLSWVKIVPYLDQLDNALNPPSTEWVRGPCKQSGVLREVDVGLLGTDIRCGVANGPQVPDAASPARCSVPESTVLEYPQELSLAQLGP